MLFSLTKFSYTPVDEWVRFPHTSQLQLLLTASTLQVQWRNSTVHEWRVAECENALVAAKFPSIGVRVCVAGAVRRLQVSVATREEHDAVCQAVTDMFGTTAATSQALGSQAAGWHGLHTPPGLQPPPAPGLQPPPTASAAHLSDHQLRRLLRHRLQDPHFTALLRRIDRLSR